MNNTGINKELLRGKVPKLTMHSLHSARTKVVVR
jgi:hypothetical protein